MMACEPATEFVGPYFDHVGCAQSIVVKLAPDVFDNCVCHPNALLESRFVQNAEWPAITVYINSSRSG